MRRIRQSILITTLLLISVGVVMIYSSTAIYALETKGDSMYFLKRHLLFLSMGMALIFFILKVDYRVLARFSKPLLGFSLLLLILVLIPRLSPEIAGSRRWFRLFGFSFQPSELATLVLIIYAAEYLSRKRILIGEFFQGFLPLIIITASASLLVLIQPDLGTAFLLCAIVFVLFFVSGVKASHLGISFLIASVLLLVLIFFVPYRRLRIIAFLNPWQDAKGAGFQIIQSQLALGLGGLFGKGLGNSMQKLFYLPCAHTDFIFSILGEELGLVGTLGVMSLFVILFFQGMKVVRFANDDFARFLSLGVLLMIGLEALVNIGVSLGCLPTKGLPLPFISYGGSSLVFDLVGVGLLLNVAKDIDLE